MEDDFHLILVFALRPHDIASFVFAGRQRVAASAGKHRLPHLLDLSHRAVPFFHHEKFHEDAAQRPHIDRLRILRVQQDELRRAIPARHHVGGQIPLALARLPVQFLEGGAAAHRPCEPEVAELHRTVRVQQDVRRLQVPVPDAHVVQIIHAPADTHKNRAAVILVQVVFHLEPSMGQQQGEEMEVKGEVNCVLNAEKPITVSGAVVQS